MRDLLFYRSASFSQVLTESVERIGSVLFQVEIKVYLFRKLLSSPNRFGLSRLDLPYGTGRL